jgi:hypothetical protein
MANISFYKGEPSAPYIEFLGKCARGSPYSGSIAW